MVWQFRQAQPGAEAAFVADGEFLFQDEVEELQEEPMASVSARPVSSRSVLAR